jgi:DNA replication and repair protein RecF
MRLTRLQARGFRNLSGETLDVDAPLVAFTGANGQGKTNLLEAVGVLGALRSFRTARPAEMLGWSESLATVEAVGESEGMTRTWRWSFGEGTRGLRRDERPVDAVSWLASLRAAWFVPGDVALVRGEPAMRRALLDRAVLTVQPGYLGAARELKRVLDQKGALLRAGALDPVQAEVLDSQLAQAGAVVTEARAALLQRLAPALTRAYARFGGEEGAEVRYEPWAGTDVLGADRASIARRLQERLERLAPAERQQRRVLGGPQRDDVGFFLRGQPARAYASQGQARSLVLAWKLAEVEVAGEDGEAPLFLLDDLGSELDPGRTARLVAEVRALGAQVFVTTTDVRFLPADVNGARVYAVEAGSCSPTAPRAGV